MWWDMEAIFSCPSTSITYFNHRDNSYLYEGGGIVVFDTPRYCIGGCFLADRRGHEKRILCFSEIRVLADLSVLYVHVH